MQRSKIILYDCGLQLILTYLITLPSSAVELYLWFLLIHCQFQPLFEGQVQQFTFQHTYSGFHCKCTLHWSPFTLLLHCIADYGG